MALNMTQAIVYSPADAQTTLRRTEQQTDFINGNFSGVQNFQVAVLATANININSTGVGSIIDGYTLVGNDLVELTGQTTTGQNGIYKAVGSVLVLDPVSAYRFTNAQFGTTQVMNGTVNSGSIWQQNTVGATLTGSIFSPALSFENIASKSANNAPTVEVTKIATVAIAAGQVVAIDTANAGQVVLCDCTTNSSTSYIPYGVATTGASIGGQIFIAVGGQVTIPGASFTAGQGSENVWVDPTTVGGYTLTPPATVGTYRSSIGTVSSATQVTLSTIGQVAELITS